MWCLRAGVLSYYLYVRLSELRVAHDRAFARRFLSVWTMCAGASQGSGMLRCMWVIALVGCRRLLATRQALQIGPPPHLCKFRGCGSILLLSNCVGDHGDLRRQEVALLVE